MRTNFENSFSSLVCFIYIYDTSDTHTDTETDRGGRGDRGDRETEGKSIFTQEAVGIGFYNNIWVAVGKSTNSIAYSLNGFDWTGLGMRFSNAGLCLKHNGSRWLAGGDSIGNTFAYSDDGINWTTVDCGLNIVRDIAYSDSTIIAVGDRTNTSWELVSNTMTNWNGSFEEDDLSSYIISASGLMRRSRRRCVEKSPPSI